MAVLPAWEPGIPGIVEARALGPGLEVRIGSADL
jgi:hypothetical protein